jgi:hypothetical protein
LIATLAIGVTLPSASIRTGTVFLMAVATSTGTDRGAFARGACATAPPDHDQPDHKPPRVAAKTPPAATNTTSAPHTKVRFFIIAVRSAPGPGPLRLPLCLLVPRTHNDSFWYASQGF